MVDAFPNDPLCFSWLQPVVAEFFFPTATDLADLAAFRNIRRDLPIYFFSGTEDPVGQPLRGVAALIRRYRQADVFGLSYDFYPGRPARDAQRKKTGASSAELLRWIAKVID